MNITIDLPVETLLKVIEVNNHQRKKKKLEEFLCYLIDHSCNHKLADYKYNKIDWQRRKKPAGTPRAKPVLIVRRKKNEDSKDW